MDKNLFTFAKNKHKARYNNQLTFYDNIWKRFFRSKSAIVLFTFWLLLIVVALVFLFFSHQPFKDVHNLKLDENVQPIFFKNSHLSKLLQIKYNPKNEITQQIVSDLKLHNIKVNLLDLPTGKYWVFNQREAISVYTNGNKAFFGTDWLGRDVLVYTLKIFVLSVAISFLLLFLELFTGLSIGSFLAYKDNKFSKYIINFFNIFISIPDVIYLFMALLFAHSPVILYFMIFILGFLRMTYWSYNYAREERKKEYVIALKATGTQFLRLNYNHIIPAIFGRIIILFARRVSYIIFLVGTISFLGFQVDWNIGSIFKDNYKNREKNIWQVIFPTIYLMTFLVINQFLAINLAKILDIK